MGIRRHRLGFLIPGLEIPLPQTEIMGAGLVRLACAVEPGVHRQGAALLKHRISIRVLGLLGQPVAPLQHQNLQAGGCQSPGQGAATGATADDHQIEVGSVFNLSLLGNRQGRAVDAGEQILGRHRGHGLGIEGRLVIAS